MKAGLSLVLAGLLLLGGVALFAGRAPFARLAFMAGLPQLAARISDEPAVAGVGWYLAGDHARADDALRAAGRGSTYNRGLSLAATGDLPLARAYFLAVLFASPADSQARDNLAVIEARIPPHVGQANNAGRISAQAFKTDDGTANDGVRRLARPLDLGGRVADEAWLQALPDDPGEFLRLRLAEEHLRRLAIGLTAPQEGDPW